MRIGADSARELESCLIQQVRTQVGISRVEMARRLELAPSTVGHYVDRLVQRGFLRETGKQSLSAGRPATQLDLNPAAGHFVGVDFDATQIWISVVDFAQKHLARSKTRIMGSDTAATVVAKIQTAIAEVTEGLHPMLGIGVGTPGAIDSQQGVSLHYEYIPGWRNIPLRQKLADRFAVPVAIENNMRVMAMAEDLFGQGRGVEDFICLGIRSGIGAGIFLDGHLHSGPNHLAGEIGGWPCESGKTLEQLASFSGLTKVFDEALRTGLTSFPLANPGQIQREDIIHALRNGNPFARETIWHAGKVIGKVVAQMNLVLNPRQVIIAGPLAEFDAEFINAIRATLKPLIQPAHSSMPIVTGSLLGEYAGALGGAALAVRDWVPHREN